ncbi:MULTISPECIES: ABC transporter ATP-binding protein [Ensifer]|uniref:Spermidine/putrescine import ATP-binding protein PotA n=1 Tax=Ensifer canadensis TaxID=555315 RepID=A0AAW4FTI4_9HYPH|nr:MULTISPECIES: ABC transporter ATP-binding protein [Ensifer]KQW52678.1 ABC transporter ATP-binding protein [Ensifer sp. Root1252]KRC71092.1 ABC transporter ATP-binding protein [Ensifer sp. Root231]KRC96124.1 ABC transporter ATP-binding protein [Ensifer sp. Root258]MBM3094686.1 polyamine ABC transporter ATP-binding protein [Ensifer canadensis]UBI79598.1 ABC transporter ATP-binding protein [Ensifer canadensis]
MNARSLTLRSVNKSYDGKHMAADDVSLDIKAGEFVSFLGPSGSGKTTTLMMIAGFQHPTSGEIRLGERAIDKLPPHKRNIGMVFQNYALFPHMTIADNVAFPLRMRGVERAEKDRRSREALAKVGLQGFEKRVPSELSGGQQQRVALARALVFQPDVILLDEPLGALDKALREHMQVELKRIHRDLGVTMVYVTHDQSEAMTMSDRIAVFNGGRIEQVGTPNEIYFAPKSRFVASFIGDSNIIAATSLGGGRFETPVGVVDTKAAGGDRNTKAELLLRPEMIRLAVGAEAGRQPMKIDSTINYGDNLLVIGKLGSQAIRMRVPGVDARRLDGASECHVTWRSEDVHVIA